MIIKYKTLQYQMHHLIPKTRRHYSPAHQSNAKTAARKYQLYIDLISRMQTEFTSNDSNAHSIPTTEQVINFFATIVSTI